MKENIEILLERINQICAKRGIKEEITVVAVTKGVPLEKIQEAKEAGIKIIGENRVQEAYTKYQVLKDAFEWHMIGHLQTNKVKKALEFFSVIQSVDSLHLAQEIDRRAKEKNRVVPILIEVNTSQEETKFGVKEEDLFPLIENLLLLRNIKLTGLMTLGPGLAVFDPEKSRPAFRKLSLLKKEIEERFSLPPGEFRFLSMGMSSDYEVAIEEGSNMIRIGTVIFGERR